MTRLPEANRPTLVVRTSPKQRLRRSTIDETPKTGSSILAYPEPPRKASDPSPLETSQWGDDDELSPLQPVSPLPVTEDTVVHYGPPGKPGSFEYKRWFNAILLHDLEACINQIQQYAKRGLRQGYGDEIDAEIVKRRDVACECLQGVRCYIKKAIQSAQRNEVSPTTLHCFNLSDNAKAEEELEVWMNMKSNANVEMFCCYDEFMRAACGTWKMGGVEEANAAVGVDWMSLYAFAKLLEEYEQLIMK